LAAVSNSVFTNKIIKLSEIYFLSSSNALCWLWWW